VLLHPGGGAPGVLRDRLALEWLRGFAAMRPEYLIGYGGGIG